LEIYLNNRLLQTCWVLLLFLAMVLDLKLVLALALELALELALALALVLALDRIDIGFAEHYGKFQK
jgi:hypothetical protein